MPNYVLMTSPTFPGTTNQPLTLFGVEEPPGGTSGPTRAYDGNTTTSFYTTAAMAPAFTRFTVDLGALYLVAGIDWLFRLPGGDDFFNLQLSANATSWTDLQTFGPHAADNVFYGIAPNINARYMKIQFNNSGVQEVLGYLGEIRVWTLPAATRLSSSSSSVVG